MPKKMDKKPSRGILKKAPSSSQTSGKAISDPRFTALQTSSLYRPTSKKETHVPVDARFARMLSDERFTSRAKVDRYGRKLDPEKGRKKLEKLYRFDGEGEKREGEEKEDEVDDDEEVQAELRRVAGKGYDPARDGGFSESSSSEDSSSDEEDEENEEVIFPDQQEDVPEGEVTARMAVVNLDWDHIRAVDLLAVFSSFVPSGGRILKVQVFPSEFGKERMDKEEIEGPPKEIFATKKADPEEDISSDEGDEEDEEAKIKKEMLKEDKGEEFNSSRLRAYQLERLRYYYAVLTCSSPACAKAMYDSVDGTEYLSTSNFFDLRFIPDEMEFDDEPRDEAEKVPEKYKPNDFVTDALQHSKVKLTWDADDTVRQEAQRKAFSGSRAEIEENDLKAYLGSDSSESEDDEAEATNGGEAKPGKKELERQRMRALLGLGEADPTAKESGPVGDMEVTFSAGLSGSAGGPLFDKEETTVEKYVRKEKERKARRKEKLKASRNGATDEAPAAEPELDEGAKEDLGFDDPFFEAPVQDSRERRAAEKADRKRREQAERAASDAATSASRAELETLIAADEGEGEDGAGGKLKHFDMNDIEKGEKLLGKKGKQRRGKKLSERAKEALAAKEGDSFRMDVADPRFSAVHEESAFAVDPSHPRFKGTEGMKALLEESRRKRAAKRGDSEEEERPRKKEKVQGKSEGLDKLVAKVKSKTKAR